MLCQAPDTGLMKMLMLAGLALWLRKYPSTIGDSKIPHCSFLSLCFLFHSHMPFLWLCSTLFPPIFFFAFLSFSVSLPSSAKCSLLFRHNHINTVTTKCHLCDKCLPSTLIFFDWFKSFTFFSFLLFFCLYHLVELQLKKTIKCCITATI